MTERCIWMYWEDPPGGRRPPYLDLCMETIRRHAQSAEIRLVGRDTAFDWLPELDHGIWTALPTPVMRADYVRTRLVHRFGGLWLDADVIAMRPLDALFDRLSTSDVVGWGWELDGRFYNNLFAARPRSDLIARWAEEQDRTLRDSPDWTRLPWSALGQDIMWPLGRRHGYDAFPVTKIAPIPWQSWRRFLSRIESPRRVVADEPLTVMLWNHFLSPHLRHLSREDLDDSPILLARLLRIALGRSSMEAESRGWPMLSPLSSLRFSTNGQRIELRARRAWEALASSRVWHRPG